MTLGDVIKNYRTTNKISMDDFSKLSGISKAYISMLEKNENPKSKKPIVPSLEVIKSVSKVVGIDLNELIDLLGNRQEISLVSMDNIYRQIPLSEKENQLVEYFRLLNNKGKERMLEDAEMYTMLAMYCQKEEVE